MQLLLVHHADALPPEVDHMRPLSSVGLGQADRVAAEAAARGAKPAAIWHSGKLRARQTAEACLRTLNPYAQFLAVRGLQPDDDPDHVAVQLEAEPRDILVAGHFFNLPRLLHRLLTGRNDGGMAEFPQHGAVMLERTDEGWVEKWRVSSQ